MSMKKLIFGLSRLFLLSLLFLIAFVNLSFAANASTVVSSDIIVPYNSDLTAKDIVSKSRIITITVLADDGDASINNLTLNEDTAGINSSLLGWHIWRIAIIANTGATEITTDSDIFLKVSSDDLLGGSGVDSVDNDANNIIVPLDINSLFIPTAIYGDLILSTIGNAINSAALTYILILK